MITSNDQLVWVPLTPEDKQDILNNSKQRGTLNKRTLVGGEGNDAGFGGELILKIYAPFLSYAADNPNWDFVTPNGLTIDVKSKGNCRVEPEPNYDCTVPVYQTKAQTNDYYVFTRLHRDLTGGWLLGFIAKDKFVEIAAWRSPGQRYNNAGRATVGSHRVLPIASLLPMELFSEYMKSKKAVSA